MRSKPSVIVAPDFRRVDEIFDSATLARLDDLVDVQWGRDGAMPAAQFEQALQHAAAVVFGTWHYGPDAIVEAGPSLRHVFEVAGGHFHPDLDYETCFEREITVGGCAPAFGSVVAEMALALTLASTRGVTKADADFRLGRERWLHDGNVGAVTLFGRTVGFVGAGGLSRSLQELLEPFDVRFLAHDPWVSADTLRNRSLQPVDLPTLFAQSDIVYVLAVPSPDNRHLVSRYLMGLLEPDDVLVVISRAHLVDFDAMTDLVLAGRFRAAIDVFPSEPLEAQHPIRRASGVVLSAHRSGAMPDALLAIGRMVVDDLEVFLTGRGATRMQYATPDLIRRLRGETAPP